MSATTSKVITFRADDVTALEERAKASGVTRSEYLRQLVAGLGQSGGAWVVGYHGAEPHSIHATEVDALRAHASGFGQYVKFWPWGERPEEV